MYTATFFFGNSMQRHFKCSRNYIYLTPKILKKKS